MRHFRAIALVAMIAVAGCTGDDDAASEPRSRDRVEIDVAVPDTDDLTDAVLPGLTEGEVAFAAYEGRPVVVNFFAHTCPPCVQEMPAIESVKQDLGDEVAFVGIATNDPVDEATALVERTGVTWDLARDPQGEFIAAVGGIVMPTTLIVGRGGEVLDVHSGELSADDLRELLREHAGVDA